MLYVTVARAGDPARVMRTIERGATTHAIQEMLE
jgi:hypothetical protein